ncbi:DUF305 domain-containing protein [Porticoccaceae bacterium]|jgi:uncharacterized protein (DUF305 family)|nr:DUF305 domain-containing protein [Porticoccaceae bacterium]MDA8597533.1 DUF305 domain-containing protein [Porticoccaceae bacterium]MDA8878230.1 DUF305 domain-containing protein [Porticoccaceae bacterium]MDA9583752.1 DUF305 domain-containing protein [Porticoccaceae bacterium]
MRHFNILIKKMAIAILVAVSSTCVFASIEKINAPIVQPGAPGQPSQALDADTAIAIADSSYSSADVHFMQGMILHHHQALLMSRLASDRTNNENVLDLAGRIDVSQDDEITLMQDWLKERSEMVPDPADHHSGHMGHGMVGMANAEQMTNLANSKSINFDELFLSLMITHHDGAIKMVKELRDQPGSAYDPLLNEFVSDVANDQAVEIERMNELLVGLSSDPRAGLAPGLFDAEEAILNLELVVSQRKPPGFYDPNNPAARGAAALENEVDEEDKPKTTQKSANALRYPMLSFSNTDMAFSDDLLVTGSYHGFNMYQLQDSGIPNLVSSVVCPGGQGDVSIVGDLLIMSVEQTRGRLDCGLQGVSEDISDERFRGIRIFDISDITSPIQVGAVQTCRGSHTHSVVSGPDADGKILVYNSGTSSVRKEEELENCIDGTPGDDRTALFRIDVIEIPMDDPSKSRIIDSPTVFADPETGALAGLWRGGDHGDDTQETYRTDQCHDITVFPSANLAAGACSGNGILFDITDPRKPTRIDAVTDAGFAYWHSATFNNDGTKILFTDEWGGGGRARCRAWDPITWGADAIYDIVDQKLEFKGNYKIPAPQLETENCVAHNGSIIPVPGRDIFIQAWYQGGISVIDFTDSTNPVEIAYFDRGPIHEKELLTGGFWSVYYYQGAIYGTEIARGLDVLKLLPSEFLSANEIAAAALAYPAMGPSKLFNPQQQIPMAWPDMPIVASAYVDQFERAKAISSVTADNVRQLLSQLAELIKTNKSSTVGEVISSIKKEMKSVTADQTTVDRFQRTLEGIASQSLASI